MLPSVTKGARCLVSCIGESILNTVAAVLLALCYQVLLVAGVTKCYQVLHLKCFEVLPSATLKVFQSVSKCYT